jgi:hypothetical protein
MHKIFSRSAPALALCLPLLAIAQSSRSDPADAGASAPALRYRSAFADYRPWHDVKPGGWRELNDRLAPVAGQASGHAGHGSAAAAPAAKPSAPAASGHPSHRMHGGRP